MPYIIEKVGPDDKPYCLIRKDGSRKSCHETKAKAEAARNLIMGKEHGWKPSYKKFYES